LQSSKAIKKSNLRPADADNIELCLGDGTGALYH
jgi:hypothetical protein